MYRRLIFVFKCRFIKLNIIYSKTNHETLILRRQIKTKTPKNLMRIGLYLYLSTHSHFTINRKSLKVNSHAFRDYPASNRYTIFSTFLSKLLKPDDLNFE